MVHRCVSVCVHVAAVVCACACSDRKPDMLLAGGDYCSLPYVSCDLSRPFVRLVFINAELSLQRYWKGPRPQIYSL